MTLLSTYTLLWHNISLGNPSYVRRENEKYFSSTRNCITIMKVTFIEEL